MLVAVALATRGQAAGPGTITTIAGGWVGDGGPATSGILYRPAYVATDGTGAVYVADYWNCRVRRISGETITTVAGNGTCGYSGDDGSATAAALDQPRGPAVSASGDLYNGGLPQLPRPPHERRCDFNVFQRNLRRRRGPATSGILIAPIRATLDGGGSLHIGDPSGGASRWRVSFIIGS